MSISLAIIAKNEKEQICRIIHDYEEFFDEIHIAYDQVAQDLEMHIQLNALWSEKIHIHQYLWIDDFADKRNFLSSKITTDYYVRIDTDDMIIGTKNIAFMCQKMQETNTDIVMCYYQYTSDENGNPELAHFRETIIKNDKKLYWKKPVHESLVCDNPSDVRFYRDDECKIRIIHLTNGAHRAKSVERNIAILEKEYTQDGDNTDPRTLAYLGRTYCEQKQHEKAIEFLSKHISKSGWDEDRYISYLYLADALFDTNQVEMGYRVVFRAIMERPDFPAAYAKLCELSFNSEKWFDAIEWGKVALAKGHPNTNMCFDASLIDIKIPVYLSICHLQINDHKTAIALFDSVYKKAPDNYLVSKFSKLFSSMKSDYKYMDSLLTLINYTKEHEPSKMEQLVMAIPSSLDGHDMIIDLKNHYLPSKTWDDSSVVIYCGSTPHFWGPNSLSTGIGGSEEAAVSLSRELVKLGHPVTVYLNIEEETIDQGVSYIPYKKFNRNDKFATLVGWRQNISSFDIKAKNHVLWIHDLPNVQQLTAQKIKNLDKIVVLSNYHKSLIPEHAQWKAVISTNGINACDFEGCENIVKIPKRIIYASSYDRGLKLILSKWHDVKQSEPLAELHCYYGWNTYDKYVNLGLTTNEVKNEIVALMDQEGVYDHGRVGHKELAEAYAQSSVFAYPCSYTGEINCIALTKAIAANCNVITNDFAVMLERSPNAVASMIFIDELIETLKLEPKQGINSQYIDTMTWDKVAKQWESEVL